LRVERLAEEYKQLQSLRWSHKEIMLAAKTGYNWRSHITRPRRLKFFSKCGYGPHYLWEWLEHHYRRTKAASLGVSFDDFLSCWQQFEVREIYRGGSTQLLSTLNQLNVYMRARRTDLPHDEARSLACYRLYDVGDYLALRGRGITSATTRRILQAAPNWFDYRRGVKPVINALRYGATVDEIIERMHDNSLDIFAVQLRASFRSS